MCVCVCACVCGVRVGCVCVRSGVCVGVCEECVCVGVSAVRE